MATQTTDQQMQLKDAMARAKQIAAKLQQQHGPEESRKRSLTDSAPTFPEEQIEPQVKRPAPGGVDHNDPKAVAQQVANTLVQRAGFGSMQVEEVTIPNKLVGLVIGRGGEMINKLQSDSGAKIQVAPDPPPEMAQFVEERQITITGMSDAVNKAKNIIDEIRTEGKIPERLLAGTAAPGDYSMEMKIPSTKVGLVIGKGGETIKSLQERAGCKMVLFQDGEHANAPEKPLRISGLQDKVMYGKQLVQDLLTQKELEAMGQDKFHQGGPAPGGSYDEVQVPRSAVGFVIGAKGANINNIQQMTGCRIQFKNEMVGDFKVAMITGNPQQVAMGKAKLHEILQSGFNGPRGQHNNWNNGPQQGFNSQGPRWGGNQGGPRQWGPSSRGPNQFGTSSLPPGHKHMIINVPANKCGLVIGKGGETLKYIHNETKVNIEINREIPQDSPFRAFHVKGTDEQIDKALNIIRDKINDKSIVATPAEGSGGPSGPGAPGQAPWNGPQQTGWTPTQNQWSQPNQQWAGQQGGWQPPPQQDQWGQGAWNQSQQQQQSGGWNQPQQQQPGGWNQPAAPQAPWDQQNQQQNQWGQQYQWGQPYQQPATSVAPAAASSAPATGTTTADTTQAGTTQTATGQPDYSAAWALYYQQQQQYYQQYGMQQPGAVAAPASTAAATNSTTGTPTSSTPNQAQAMADYQAKYAEYYKSYNQQPPQQQQPPQ